MTHHTIVFYADADQCRAWDDEMLSTHPALATAAKEEWRTKPGWYWRRTDIGTGEVIDDGGPCATDGEARVEDARSRDASQPEEIAAAFEDALDKEPEDTPPPQTVH